MNPKYIQQSHNRWLEWNRSLPEGERWGTKSEPRKVTCEADGSIWSEEIQLQVIPQYEKAIDQSVADQLWEMMYAHIKAVIVQCPYCASHNAVTNSTCVRCGAPMGDTL